MWNILNKLFLGRKVPRGRTESAVPPLDSTLALLFGSAYNKKYKSELFMITGLILERKKLCRERKMYY
ncbi:hypothetical protein DW061_09495 [Ruminococcus sp. AF42-9BH]|nr:hypothetical protein DW061_09495 [Ruminococcus sp. AF42-9BH]